MWLFIIGMENNMKYKVRSAKLEGENLRRTRAPLPVNETLTIVYHG